MDISTPVTRSTDLQDRARGPGWFGTISVLTALASALTTFLVLAGMTPILPTRDVVFWVLFANGCLVVLLIGLIAFEARDLIRARRAGAAAARLHIRIVGLFSLVAIIPAILVAIVASVTLERGLDPWFTGSIKSLMNNTVEVARSYRDAQCRMLGRETNLMAVDLNRAKVIFDADRKVFREFMMSRAMFLGFPVAMLLEPDGRVVERAEAKPIENLPPLDAQDLKDATDNEPLCLIPRNGNVFRTILRLPAHNGRILFIARPVDPRAIEFLPEAEAGFAYYQALEAKKFGIQIAFASMFALVALIVLLSAVWFGLSFANRLVAPVRRLIHATDQVAIGNFYVQVPVRNDEDDLAHLGETFNKMTSELRRQHDGLTAANDVIDRRRRFTEAVLSGVPAGIVGIDPQGLVTILNPSAETFLGSPRDQIIGRPLADAAPEIAQLIQEAKTSRQKWLHQQVQMTRSGRERTINVQVTSEQARAEDKGFVVTLDDITDLVAAQRTSAWADVARRIAHEIKNPLTPIQLSAERIRRKYGKTIVADREIFDQCVETIVRQVDDIKRMVDEFSSFARMPKPAIGQEDLKEILQQTAFMMRIANPSIDIVSTVPPEPAPALFDRRLVSQALTNIIKNAVEAIESAPGPDSSGGRIEVGLRHEADRIVIDIVDNGKGFPTENRQRLLEPYMTTREGGTGLGLAIVGKIFEDHGGGIELLDNPQGRGACVRLWLPVGDGVKGRS